jgi:hypothetical protein
VSFLSYHFIVTNYLFFIINVLLLVCTISWGLSLIHFMYLFNLAFIILGELYSTNSIIHQIG